MFRPRQSFLIVWIGVERELTAGSPVSDEIALPKSGWQHRG
jgi:hypothetical protein